MDIEINFNTESLLRISYNKSIFFTETLHQNILSLTSDPNFYLKVTE